MENNMVDALARLAEEGNFARCIEAAEQMISQGGWSAFQLATIHLINCRCRLHLQDAHGALRSGAAAATLARQEEEYDLLGRALLYQGTAHAALQQYDQALRCFYDYFTYMAGYHEAQRLEGAVWKHLGVTYQRQLEPEKAAYALEEARRWFAAREIDHGAFTSTHDLINVYLYLADTDPSKLRTVRSLLTAQRAIAHRHLDDLYYAGTFLLDLAAWLARTGRPRMAAVAATRALEVYQGDRAHSFHCHLLLHRCRLARGDGRRALGHLLAAWSDAVAAGSPELEHLAAESLADALEREASEILRELGTLQSGSAATHRLPAHAPMRRDLQ